MDATLAIPGPLSGFRFPLSMLGCFLSPATYVMGSLKE
jgi:hypothetical protein